jgi:predicted transcriptional regulator
VKNIELESQMVLEMTKSEYRREMKLNHNYPMAENSEVQKFKDTGTIRNLKFL